ncbi:hypothetical protein WDU94_007403 [Cyamophila willieti]
MFLVESYLLLFLIFIQKGQSAWPTWPSEWSVELTHNGPIVAGNTITFKCIVSTDTDHNPKENFKYLWEDIAVPQHSGVVESTSNVFEWNITYPADQYYPGVYEVQVKVERKLIIYIPISSKRTFFNITGFLNGQLSLIQNDKEIAKDKYVALNQEMTHTVVLNAPDAEYLTRNATDIETYIFIDCQYINVTKGLTFKRNYTDLYSEHLIEALVVVSFDPPVIVPTTPIPPSTNGTTLSPPNTGNSTQTILSSAPASKILALPPTTVTPSASSTTVLPLSNSTSSIAPPSSTTLPPNNGFPYVCNNSSQVPPDLSKTYGYFSRKVKVEAAITHVTAVGAVWLQHGDMLDLEIKCNGTGPFNFCYSFVYGPYNVTGNESCVPLRVRNECSFPVYHYFAESTEYILIVVLENNVGKVITLISRMLSTSLYLPESQPSDTSYRIKCNGTGPFNFCYSFVYGPYNVTGNESCVPLRVRNECSFPVYHYFAESTEYILIVVLENNVGKVITPVGVNIYEATKQAQLSVIVVPIVFVSMAVIIIVFGLAYYVQSRTRFVIETADFDFSNTDMEYKTFSERLRDAISAAINKPEDFVEAESVWSPPGQSAGRRYGSMQ